jgi:hypothetical protein
MDENEQDDLDMSWLKEEEQIQNMEHSYYREPIDEINIYFIHINKSNYIDKITSKKQTVDRVENEDKCVLNRNVLLKLIQSNKILTPTSKYKLIDILAFLVDLEPMHIQNYAKNEKTTYNFFKVLNNAEEIFIPPSIFIFHEVNAIYFIYREVELEKHRHTIKSILKKEPSREPSVGSQKPTKKVRMLMDEKDKIKKSGKRNTRKIITKTI